MPIIVFDVIGYAVVVIFLRELAGATSYLFVGSLIGVSVLLFVDYLSAQVNIFWRESAYINFINDGFVVLLLMCGICIGSIISST
jgi:hypothetical protein